MLNGPKLAKPPALIWSWTYDDVLRASPKKSSRSFTASSMVGYAGIIPLGGVPPSETTSDFATSLPWSMRHALLVRNCVLNQGRRMGTWVILKDSLNRSELKLP